MRTALLTGLILTLSACQGYEESSPSDLTPPSNSIAPAPSGSENSVSGPSDVATRPDAGTKPDAGTPPDAGTRPPDAGTPPATNSTEVGMPTPPKASPAQPQWPELQKFIGTYTLTLSQSDYDALYAHIPDPPSKDFSVKGQFTSGNHAYTVDLKFRGRSTKTDPRIVKKSWAVGFDKNDRFQGRKDIELLAEWKDAGYLTEKLWYDMAASVGLRVPYARYAQVVLRLTQKDGSVVTRPEGVFTELESINKDFLKAHGFDGDGDIYRCGMHDCELRQPPQEVYQEKWDKKTNETQPWDALWSFLEDLNRAPNHQFPAVAARELELEDYLTWLTVETLIANDLQGDARSYLVRDTTTNKWTYVPWDLNNALSQYNRTNAVIQGVKRDHPLFSFTPYDPKIYELADFRATFPGMEDMKPAYSTLSTRIYDDPGLRARYAQRLRALLDTWFTEANLNARVDAMAALLAPYVLPGPDGKTVDPYVSVEHVKRSADYLHRFVKERRAWLLQHLMDFDSHGSDALVIDRVGRDASGAFWVQLYNRGSAPLSLDKLYLSGFTRAQKQWTLPASSVGPGQVITFVQGATGPNALGASMDAAHPEVSLYGADGRTALDVMWLAPLAPGEAYGRSPRGAETFGPQSGPQ